MLSLLYGALHWSSVSTYDAGDARSARPEAPRGLRMAASENDLQRREALRSPPSNLVGGVVHLVDRPHGSGSGRAQRLCARRAPFASSVRSSRLRSGAERGGAGLLLVVLPGERRGAHLSKREIRSVAFGPPRTSAHKQVSLSQEYSEAAPATADGAAAGEGWSRGGQSTVRPRVLALVCPI